MKKRTSAHYAWKSAQYKRRTLEEKKRMNNVFTLNRKPRRNVRGNYFHKAKNVKKGIVGLVTGRARREISGRGTKPLTSGRVATKLGLGGRTKEVKKERDATGNSKSKKRGPAFRPKREERKENIVKKRAAEYYPTFKEN